MMKRLLLTLFLCSSLFAQGHNKPSLGEQIYWSYSLSRDTAGYWLMSEGAGSAVADLSGNGSHGSFGAASATPTWVTGPHGSALEFDGTDDYISCGYVADVRQLTISAWIKAYDTTSRRIVGKSRSTASPPYAQYLVGLTSGSKLYLAADHSNALTTLVTSLTSITNVWTHFCVTYDGTWSRIYINGRLNNSDNTYAGDLVSHPDYEFRIGMAVYDSVTTFDGVISEVEVWSRALSPSEIASLYRDPYAMFQQQDPLTMYATAGGEPPATSPVPVFQRHYEQMRAGVPVALPILTILSMAFLMRRSKTCDE